MKEYSVSEISKIIANMFKLSFSEPIVVTGEVSDMSNKNSSGHIYFSLKEGDSSLSATFFSFNVKNNPFIPKNGDKVKVYGELKIYDRQSRYQINVRKIEYDSEGLLWKQFEETKKKLMAEGLFDQSRKREIPQYPYRVAVLTSYTGSVIRDFLVTTKNESGRYLIDLWNIPVQNIEMADKIAQTIEKAGNHTEHYDVIVVMRGGGSMEDLSVFNQEVIARAVASSKIPVISAVGHETDYTIIDFVADYRAATPTAAASFLSSHYKSAIPAVDNLHNKLITSIYNVMGHYSQDIDTFVLKLENKSPEFIISKLEHQLLTYIKKIQAVVMQKIYFLNKYIMKTESSIAKSNPEYKVENYNLRILNYSKHIHTGMISNIEKKKNHLNNLEIKIRRYNPVKNIEGYLYKLDTHKKLLYRAFRDKSAAEEEHINKYKKELEKFISEYLFDKTSKLAILDNKLRLLDPYNVMERGYALVYQEDKIISKIEDVSLQKNIYIKLKDGSISALPETIQKDNDSENIVSHSYGNENIFK